jgi:hypothetical protein
MNTRDTLTVPEVAQLKHRSTSHVYHAAMIGELQSCSRRPLRFRRAVVLAWKPRKHGETRLRARPPSARVQQLGELNGQTPRELAAAHGVTTQAVYAARARMRAYRRRKKKIPNMG